jgi:hypothetical protein
MVQAPLREICLKIDPLGILGFWAISVHNGVHYTGDWYRISTFILCFHPYLHMVIL